MNMSIPINVDNLHHVIKQKIKDLAAEGFSIKRYKREVFVEDEIDIHSKTVSEVMEICDKYGVDYSEAVIEPESGNMGDYSCPAVFFERLETNQEAANRAIDSWKSKRSKEEAKKEKEDLERIKLRELMQKYPNEL
jgi:homospermidine synthase